MTKEKISYKEAITEIETILQQMCQIYNILKYL